MELIVISESKLKIMLSEPDMRRYELTAEAMDYADEGTRRAFRHIFEDARARSGFETDGQRLLVQLYASKEGGCEIFVTKLGPQEAPLPPERRALTAPEEALIRRVMDRAPSDPIPPTTVAAEPSATPALTAMPATTRSRWAALGFPSMADLLAACRRLLDAGYADESHAYIHQGPAEPAPTYLFLRVPDHPFFRLPDRYAFLLEYGKFLDPEPLRLFVTEYASPLCAFTAVATLGELG